MANDESQSPASFPKHPGEYVRDEVLNARDLQVASAAKALGVGRPALSNFLNGNASATPEMARRLEVVFHVKAEDILEMQSAYDAFQARLKAPLNVTPYVVPLLSIRTRDLEAWVNQNIDARKRLPVLLRTLVNSTTTAITKSDFPGNDDAERHGADGIVECGQATPWVPLGRSIWEFGTNAGPKAKADGDFAKSVKAISAEERGQSTFVFVTPREWKNKGEWAAEHAAKGLWKAVRAYDGSDLEQWIDQSVPAQAWFANEVRLPSEGVRSLDQAWSDWASVTDPVLSPVVFQDAVDAASDNFKAKLAATPPSPLVLAADSHEEALAFLSHLFSAAGGEELARFRDRVVIFDRPGTIPRLAKGSQDFIAVVSSREIERELAPYSKTHRSIVVYAKGAVDGTPDFVVEPLSASSFANAMDKLGIEDGTASRLAAESGRSLTVLRRRLATVPAVRRPLWAEFPETSSLLVPLLFAGAWNRDNLADQQLLCTLAATKDFDEIERKFLRLSQLNDSPLWSGSSYRGVISKIDLLFAISHAITTGDLERFFGCAKQVLGEDDPKLDLPEDKRWAAGIYGKRRLFSAAMRNSIAEALVLLAVHGNHLFKNRLGFDCEQRAASLVMELLTPLGTRILEANESDLSAYAEAAPDAFLSILERDLNSEHPATHGLMRPVRNDLFASCPRSGLLWALEGLAWNPLHLGRVVNILASLATIELTDNWMNRPINSLLAIFSSWLPQTTATFEERALLVAALAQKHPKAAWQICIAQLKRDSIGNFNHRPKWRRDGYDYNSPDAIDSQAQPFIDEVRRLTLSWERTYTAANLADLIEVMPDFSPNDQLLVWEKINAWARHTATDAERASLLEQIRVNVGFENFGSITNDLVDTAPTKPASAREAFASLQPTNPFDRWHWLFREHWIPESAAHGVDDNFDFEEHENRIHRLRAQALQEIYNDKGFDGLRRISAMGNAAYVVGDIAARSVLMTSDLPALVVSSLPGFSDPIPEGIKPFLAGVLHSLEHEQCQQVMKEVEGQIWKDLFARLLTLARFEPSTWAIVDRLGAKQRRIYWEEVRPPWLGSNQDFRAEAVQRLMTAGRPRAAFNSLNLGSSSLDEEILFQLLSEVARSKEAVGANQLQDHAVARALQSVSKSSRFTLEQKAGIEMAYLEFLAKPWRTKAESSIPNLELYIEFNPEFYVQLVAWVSPRSDDGTDPPELKTEPEAVERMQMRGYTLLNSLARTPGRDEPPNRQNSVLASWLSAVRKRCAEVARLDSCDLWLGQLLAKSLPSGDGTWPNNTVRQVMEDIQSPEMMRGAYVAAYNARGTGFRGPGGDQERALAQTYTNWAERLRYTHPFVATHLLYRLAETYRREAEGFDADELLERRLR